LARGGDNLLSASDKPTLAKLIPSGFKVLNDSKTLPLLHRPLRQDLLNQLLTQETRDNAQPQQIVPLQNLWQKILPRTIFEGTHVYPHRSEAICLSLQEL
jgi:hypothetical protein